MSNKDNIDLNVPARVASGWGYVVTLEGGKERYLHSTQPLERIKAMLIEAIQNEHPILVFDGAQFTLDAGPGEEPLGPDCAGFVMVDKILAISYAGPIDRLAIEETSRRFEQLADEDDQAAQEEAEAEAAAKAAAEGKTPEGAEAGSEGNADAEALAFGGTGG